MKLRPTTVDALVIAVWGFAVGFWLWGSGLDVALQDWLYTNYNQAFNDNMRLLGWLSLGRTQIWGLVGLGGICALYYGGLYGLGQALKLTVLQWGAWLRGKRGWLQNWAETPAFTRIAFTALGVMAINGVLQVLAKCLIGRPRPKEWLWNGTSPYTPHPFGFDSAFWSMPSGHASSTFVLAVWLALAFPHWRLPILSIATCMACSRFLAVTPHYLGDVVAGAALGSAVALWISGRISERI